MDSHNQSPPAHDHEQPVSVDPAAAHDSLQACKILIIDDEPVNVRLLEYILKRAGFDNFTSTTESNAAAALFHNFQPDLVLTDWIMPELDGGALIQQLRALTASDDYLPIVVLTADVSAQVKERALAIGATDFLTKPFDPTEVVLRIRNLLSARLSHLLIQRQNSNLEDSVRMRTIELERTLTELKSSQQQVIQHERLSALGAMAAGIAHDFNNALSVIISFAEVLQRESETGLTRENTALPISTILTAAQDASKIVERLRDFHRPDAAEDERTPVDLNRLIAQAIAFTKPRWQPDSGASGRTITINTEPGEIPYVYGNESSLRNALTNLIFNAIDALPEGGAITLRTATVGKAVVLKITDTGTGMSEEVRQRCFEPFFTTKGAAGTGLGLAMVFGILGRHAGSIDIQSAPNQGTTFTLQLPAS